MAQDLEKAEVLNAAFISAFTSKTGLQKSKAAETRGKVWSNEFFRVVEGDQVREFLSNWTGPWALMGCTHKC